VPHVQHDLAAGTGSTPTDCVACAHGVNTYRRSGLAIGVGVKRRDDAGT
jgi:hypothetical protein